jgi:hypothetical protein
MRENIWVSPKKKHLIQATVIAIMINAAQILLKDMLGCCLGY